MKRARRHKVKEEPSGTVNPKEHDLAYYIHDRVELMHQVFSVLKPKELKAMAPECVRHISVNDLQELCTEELLGISSKRLCAILDGADPPSDTESSSGSSQERLETISLDSISSDDEILSQVSSKKKKHKHHSSKGKSKKRKSRESRDEDDQQDKSRRTGLTVLEILELQARARAIRAQLQKEQAAVASTGRPSESATGNSTDDDEVEIKEEAAEVVEISSEDEKPNVRELQEKIAANSKETANNESSSKTITKKVNDLVITVPKNTSRKIKLKRTPNLEKNKTVQVDKDVPTTSSNATEANIAKVNTNNTQTTVELEKLVPKETINTVQTTSESVTDKGKDKKKKKKKDKEKVKYGSDHDEITLQLSDTEKMDLLEDLEGKQFEKSSETEDSSADSDSEDESVDKNQKDKDLHTNKKVVATVNKEKGKIKISKSNNEDITKESNMNEMEVISESTVDKDINLLPVSETSLDQDTSVTDKNITDASNNSAESGSKENYEVEKINQNPVEACDISIQSVPEIVNESQNKSNNTAIEMSVVNEETQKVEVSNSDLQKEKEEADKNQHIQVTKTITEKPQIDIEKDKSNDTNNSDTQSQMLTEDVTAQSNNDQTLTNTKQSEANVDKTRTEEKSEGELSDRDSSEVEASEVAPDVVCISDEEVKGKKKKKKDKKCKKSKKSKKNKDFRESADQNFYSETFDKERGSIQINEKGDINEIKIDEREILMQNDGSSKCEIIAIPGTDDVNPISSDVHLKSDIDDDVYEILELSDDSSCYEVEEISISKEPTAEEIEALSAKIDQIDKEGTINLDDDDEDNSQENEDLEHVSWKDRYLKSTKVKKVLNTANILNAIRKKNLDLKKKLQESKIKPIKENEVIEENTSNLEEGSIQQYNTLETCNKYVDPVKDDVINENSEIPTAETETKDPVTKEMKKDAKQLLKMYKMLLKYNDITKEKDVSKKKKKKKKSKDKEKSQVTSVASSNP